MIAVVILNLLIYPPFTLPGKKDRKPMKKLLKWVGTFKPKF
jgi:hypothetical protein